MDSWGAGTAEALVRALQTGNASAVGAGAATVGGTQRVATSPVGLADRRFEIGSITKTMTATVLAWLVVGGEVAAENPVGTWLDVAGTPAAGVKLSQLATHTSGLPRLAPNHATHPAYDPQDPYASYGPAEAEAGLRAIDALHFPGTRAYSNFGYQILGLCLERATGRSLADLFRTVVFEPLGMTTATTSDQANGDVLAGTGDGKRVKPWKLRLAGPGGVVASLGDLLRYGLAAADPPKGRLGVAIEVATTCQLGWSQHPRGPVWHNGGTAGCRSMLAVSRAEGRVVAAFASDGGFDAVDAATMAVLLGEDPMDAFPTPFDGADAAPWVEQAIEIATALYDGDVASVRSAMDEQTATALTAELLSSGRATVIEPLLPLSTPCKESVDRTGRTVHVHLRATSSRTGRSLSTTVMLDEQRRVVGLRIS